MPPVRSDRVAILVCKFVHELQGSIRYSERRSFKEKKNTPIGTRTSFWSLSPKTAAERTNDTLKIRQCHTALLWQKKNKKTK